MQPAASSNLIAANPTLGRNKSTKQVTNSATRACLSAIRSPDLRRIKLGAVFMAINQSSAFKLGVISVRDPSLASRHCEAGIANRDYAQFERAALIDCHEHRA